MAGLLGCQDEDVALRTMTKLAGLPSKYFATVNTEDFIQQARNFRAMDADTGTKIAKLLSVVGATHPWTVMRAQELRAWIDSRGYEGAVRDPRGLAQPVNRFCIYCGKALGGGEKFCIICGRAA
jgi:hypothetical protein